VDTTYTGAVTVGGPPHTRELPRLQIVKLAVGPMNNNAYLLSCTATGAGVLVDAANDASRLLDLIGPAGIEAVVTTHRHDDHWQALGQIVAATGATTLAGRLDADGIDVATDVLLDDGDEVWFGDCRLEVIQLTGHTPGSVALLYRDPVGGPHLFTGDSLFPGGVGRTENAADFASLISDVTSKVFDQLPDDTWVYPGHGDDTTLGTERPSLAEWRARGW
jgi:glyoxylase-like metal-dependent hydrolase (beta-lactamase superfamily II)